MRPVSPIVLVLIANIWRRFRIPLLFTSVVSHFPGPAFFGFFVVLNEGELGAFPVASPFIQNMSPWRRMRCLSALTVELCCTDLNEAVPPTVSDTMPFLTPATAPVVVGR